VADRTKFERMLRGDWRYNNWHHLSLADFHPAGASSGLVRYASEAAGVATWGHCQRTIATQLENLARVYTVLFGLRCPPHPARRPPPPTRYMRQQL
jgi:hypothetical protein